MAASRGVRSLVGPGERYGREEHGGGGLTMIIEVS